MAGVDAASASVKVRPISGLTPEHGEQIGGHERRADAHRIAVARQVHLRAAPGARRPRTPGCASGSRWPRRPRATSCRSRATCSRCIDDAIGVAVGQRRQQHVADDAVDGRVGADAEREREQGGDRQIPAVSRDCASRIERPESATWRVRRRITPDRCRPPPRATRCARFGEPRRSLRRRRASGDRRRAASIAAGRRGAGGVSLEGSPRTSRRGTAALLPLGGRTAPIGPFRYVRRLSPAPSRRSPLDPLTPSARGSYFASAPLQSNLSRLTPPAPRRSLRHRSGREPGAGRVTRARFSWSGASCENEPQADEGRASRADLREGATTGSGRSEVARRAKNEARPEGAQRFRASDVLREARASHASGVTARPQRRVAVITVRLCARRSSAERRGTDPRTGHPVAQ